MIRSVFLLILFTASEAIASFTLGIKLVEHKRIADYKSWVPSYGTDIHWSSKNSRFILSNDTGMIEIPYENGEFDDERSFAALTPKFKIRGWVEVSGQTWILDARSMTIQTSPENAYSLPVRLKSISGLSHDDRYFYVTDMVTNTLNRLEIMDRNAVIVDSWKLTRDDIRDVLCTDEGFWLCDSRTLYFYSRSMKLIGKYKLEAEIDGIDIRGGDIWACGFRSPDIYRFSIIRGLIEKKSPAVQP